MVNLIVVWLMGLLLSQIAALPGAKVSRSVQNRDFSDELFHTIEALDAAVFDAYNQCDLKTFGDFFADDVEFYHDQSGLTRSRQSLVEAVRNNICGKVRRELVPGTLEVYPLNGYGAVEKGVHRFYHSVRDDTEPSGEAQFIHLWQNDNGVWKITRVISYDHHTLGE